MFLLNLRFSTSANYYCQLPFISLPRHSQWHVNRNIASLRLYDVYTCQNVNLTRFFITIAAYSAYKKANSPSKMFVTFSRKSWNLNDVRNPKDPRWNAITGGQLNCGGKKYNFKYCLAYLQSVYTWSENDAGFLSLVANSRINNN